MQLEGTDNLPSHETIESLRVLLEDESQTQYTYQEAMEISESLIDIYTVLMQDGVDLLADKQIEAQQ